MPKPPLEALSSRSSSTLSLGRKSSVRIVILPSQIRCVQQFDCPLQLGNLPPAARD
jgi:hypothetical protein